MPPVTLLAEKLCFIIVLKFAAKVRLFFDIYKKICTFDADFLGFLVNIAHITAADAFPSAVIEKRDGIAVNAVDLVAVTIHSIPVFALLDEEIAVTDHKRTFIGIALHPTPGTMVDVPIACTALQRHIAKREIVDMTSVDAAHKVSVFIGEIPGIVSSDAVIAVIEEVDLIAVKDGR